jgi:thymidylate kinase
MKPKLIVLMGLDGSGKSTQAGYLCAWLRDTGIKAETVWMRGESYVTRPVLSIGKAVLRAPRESKRGEGIKAGKTYTAYVETKHTMFRNRWLRRVWIGLTLVDLYITFRRAFAKLPHDTGLVILDRYIYDSFIDIDTAFGEEGREALRLLGSKAARMFPRPDLVLLLEITPEEAMRRKDDIPSAGYLEKREAVYRSIAAAVGARNIDAAKPVQEVRAGIREIVKGAIA